MIIACWFFIILYSVFGFMDAVAGNYGWFCVDLLMIILSDYWLRRKTKEKDEFRP